MTQRREYHGGETGDVQAYDEDEDLWQPTDPAELPAIEAIQEQADTTDEELEEEVDEREALAQRVEELERKLRLLTLFLLDQGVELPDELVEDGADTDE